MRDYYKTRSSLWVAMDLFATLQSLASSLQISKSLIYSLAHLPARGQTVPNPHYCNGIQAITRSRHISKVHIHAAVAITFRITSISVRLYHLITGPFRFCKLPKHLLVQPYNILVVPCYRIFLRIFYLFHVCASLSIFMLFWDTEKRLALFQNIGPPSPCLQCWLRRSDWWLVSSWCFQLGLSSPCRIARMLHLGHWRRSTLLLC